VPRAPGASTIAAFVGASLVAASGTSCSGPSASVSLPAFRDVSEAPPAIQAAARAVVRIGTPGQTATGVFISPDGLLLTNNHVLGVSVCPIEGCYANVTFLYQRGQPPTQQPQSVFVVPLAIDVGLDMALLQALQIAGGPHLATADFVTLAARDAPSLLGTHVHIVGHPEGHLKKWTEGTVIDSSGAWITTTAFILPGSSGSPILDDAGHMVGIEHRSPVSLDMFSAASVDDYSIGTSSAALVAAMAAPLPATIWSVKGAATDDDVIANQYVYLTSHTTLAMVGGAAKPVLTSLGSACDTGLARSDVASPMDLTSALDPCAAAQGWIECRTDAPAGAFGTCPGDVEAWRARDQGVFDRWKALNGQLTLEAISFDEASLSPSTAQGMGAGLDNLRSALEAAHTPLDFHVAVYLAAFGATSYAGTNLVDYFQSYDSHAGYALSGTDIAAGMLWLLDNRSVSGSDAIGFLKRLAADDHIDIGTKLYVEDQLYRAGAL
jgi:hypothetical protein